MIVASSIQRALLKESIGFIKKEDSLPAMSLTENNGKLFLNFFGFNAKFGTRYLEIVRNKLRRRCVIDIQCRGAFVRAQKGLLQLESYRRLGFRYIH